MRPAEWIAARDAPAPLRADTAGLGSLLADANALGEELWMGDQHWVGGHVTNVQGEPPEPDTVLLLHMADDESLGFSFLDAGTIQFRIPADSLLREEYSAVRAEPSSC